MPTREEIVAAIKREATANNGSAPGVERFEAATGIKQTQWRGKYWARWSDAIREAGFEPNAWQGQTLPDDDLLRTLAGLAIELGHYPTVAERNLHSRNNPGFPSAKTFDNRFGNRAAQARRLLDLSLADDTYSALYVMVQSITESDEDRRPPEPRSALASVVAGYVYMLHIGGDYKIGRSNDADRRVNEVGIQLPRKPETVHVIETDDPGGIEAYWHRRFATKRLNGEWFKLDPEDVAAFKRRTYM